VSDLFELAPLPKAVDPFAVQDAERQLIRRLVDAGYDVDAAPVKARMLLRQLAVGWGLTLPYSAPYEGRTADWESSEALEVRRRWRAKPLDEYLPGDQVRYRDEDGRWVGAASGSWDPGEDVLWIYVHGAPSALPVSDPARVQEA
jgi:hypothetical protein